jgi:hypothetical protein
MDEPLNTINYFIAGFVVIFGSIVGYIISLIVRWKNLKQDVEVLQDSEKQ